MCESMKSPQVRRWIPSLTIPFARMLFLDCSGGICQVGIKKKGVDRRFSLLLKSLKACLSH